MGIQVTSQKQKGRELFEVCSFGIACRVVASAGLCVDGDLLAISAADPQTTLKGSCMAGWLRQRNREVSDGWAIGCRVGSGRRGEARLGFMVDVFAKDLATPGR